MRNWRRCSGRVGGLIAILVVAGTARAQVPEDLAAAKDFEAHRASTTDPRHRNNDRRMIPPGATLELANIRGAGRITHIWFTINPPGPDPLRELVLRISWDGAAKPAVETPVGDFFAQGFGRYNDDFSSAAVAIGKRRALNCYWPMPFRRAARLTLTNEGARPITGLYGNIDYRLEKAAAPPRQRYFHVQYRKAFPAPRGEDYLILDTKGSGHYVGTFLAVQQNSNGWWGEGNDKFYVDGATAPTIEGTGSEDYFCGAWDFQAAFWRPFFGVPLYHQQEDKGPAQHEARGNLNTCYRWHIPDPVPFTRSLRVMIEHGASGPGGQRTPFTNNYSSLAYYYLDQPSDPSSPPLPPLPERIPHLLGSGVRPAALRPSRTQGRATHPAPAPSS